MKVLSLITLNQTGYLISEKHCSPVLVRIQNSSRFTKSRSKCLKFGYMHRYNHLFRNEKNNIKKTLNLIKSSLFLIPIGKDNLIASNFFHRNR